MLTGSTEENFETSMTGLGITIIGKCKKIKSEPIENKDFVYLKGIPLVGNEVLENKKMVTYKEMYDLINDSDVKEIIPIGSKGIKYEIESIGKIYNMKFEFNEIGIDIKKSAGPASCLVYISSKLRNNKDEINIGSYVYRLEN